MMGAESGEQRMAANVALVVGSTGITGQALVEILSRPGTSGGPWKVYGVARRPKPEWHCPDLYIRCDLLDQNETLANLSPLTDVTRMFWVTWVDRASEIDNCKDNRRMLQNVLDAILPNAKNLRHICLQTGGKHYVGSFDQWDEMSNRDEFPDAPFTEALPRLPHGHNFYYTLEDTLFRAVEERRSEGQELTWSVHRPGIVFGFALGNKMNILSTLVVYGVICKELRKPFRFPGSKVGWDSFSDASDAEVVAEQHIWAATDPKAKNQAFNSMNGDVFKWKALWTTIADKLGLEPVAPTDLPLPLSQLMKRKERVWERIIQKYSLLPTKLSEVGHWWLAEIFFSNHGSNSIMSTNKSKEFGFLSFRNSEKSVIKHIDKMIERKIIPDYAFFHEIEAPRLVSGDQS